MGLSDHIIRYAESFEDVRFAATEIEFLERAFDSGARESGMALPPGHDATALRSVILASVVDPEGPLCEPEDSDIRAPTVPRGQHVLREARKLLASKYGFGLRPALDVCYDNKDQIQIGAASIWVTSISSAWSCGGVAQLDEPADWRERRGRRFDAYGRIYSSRARWILAIGARPSHGGHWFSRLLDG